MQILIIILIMSFAAGCGENFSAENYTDLPSDAAGRPEVPDETDPSNSLQICSKLSFSNINWPASFTTGAQNSFALALNITGSFEGSQSWATIAGDADDQGLSLGLMQQNLGSGTLQPLMGLMHNLHKSKMQSFFTPAHWSSISAMLTEWLRTNPAVEFSPLSFKGQELFQSDDTVLSPLDENSTEKVIESFATTAVAKTLTWARQNILSGKTVKADWKKEFQTLANSNEYKNFQFREAINLHEKTEDYRRYFGFKSLTSYLFLYDVVVQNGGFNNTHKNSYATYVKQNPNSTEVQRLKKLLEIRLTSVRQQYRNDVNARKSTIINGTGTVHGSQRNLPKEYCYQGVIQIDPT